MGVEDIQVVRNEIRLDPLFTSIIKVDPHSIIKDPRPRDGNLLG